MNWLWTFGVISVALIASTIAYNLLMRSVYLSQKQDMINNFNDLYTKIQSVCLQEVGNYRYEKLKVYDFVRAIYVTDNTKEYEAKVIEKIRGKETNKAKNLCLQFKDEEKLRCVELDCNVTMPYLGALPHGIDIQLFVKRLLGEAPVKEYGLIISKVSGDEVEVKVE